MTLVVATFLAVLALVTLAGVVVVLVAAVIGRQDAIRGAIGPGGLWLAFAVALTATAGSLYFSEVAHMVPCTLCWYQRIAMYPLALMLGIAAWRGDWGIRRYTAPLAAIGALIAAYHVVLQRVPGLPSAGCSLTAPCSAIDLERFGFVTIPVMALIAFLAILTVLFALAPAGTPPVETPDP
ncbi:MAG TPA: disulfide oxidoreductase [Candidatus Limnocylindria bacterium]|nr:disulfide oxidoreductase [Candidatus Limnocylindria bacterium]